MSSTILEKSIDATGVAIVTLDKPPVNAFNSAEFREIAATFDELGSNPDVRVVIMTAKGKGFCAGLDVNELVEDRNAVASINRGAFAVFESIHHCAVPVIAAVHGFALGGGIAMVGASDIAIAADDTRFGLPEIDRGMLGGASHILRMLPLFAVRQAYYTGQFIPAKEVLRLGGLNAIYPQAELLPAAMALAHAIASKSPVAIRLAKEALNGIEPVDLEKNYRYEQGFTLEMSYLPDADEARKAFVEKRLPNFQPGGSAAGARRKP